MTVFVNRVNMSKSDIIKNIKNMSFEEALLELENIVKKLESGKEPLEESITAYEYGNALKLHCEEKLKSAQLKIEKIIKKSNNGDDEEIETVEVNLD